MQGWPDWAVTLLSTAFVVPAVGYVVIPLLLLIFSRWVFQPHRQATGLCGFLERGFPCC
jgi:antibiotic biosynthesis monooxygenase (ABM) superfamily enzyme